MDKQQQDKAILEDAPDKAAHYAQGMHYIARNESGDWMRYDHNGFKNAKWFAANDYKFCYVKDFRKLDDIRELIQLRDEVSEQGKRIAELEKANAKLTVIATNFQTGINMVRNLDTGTAWVSKRPSYKDELDAWTPIHRAEQMLKEVMCE